MVLPRALHADKIIESKGKIVKWKYDGKVYTKPKHVVSKVLDQMQLTNHQKLDLQY